MALTVSELKERLLSEVLVADGAMGTILQSYGSRIGLPYEMACLSHPELVEDVHRQYIQAGARMLETNTFSANRIKLSAVGAGEHVVAINRAAARLARAAIANTAPETESGPPILVAGSIGPVGKPLAPLGTVAPEVASAAFTEQAQALLEEGVDLILLETFLSVDELRLAYEAVRKLSDLPIIAHKVFIEDAETLAGGLAGRVAQEVGAWEGIVAVGANCAIGPQRMVDVLTRMAPYTDRPLSAMPTPGLPQQVEGTVHYTVTPEYFGRYARSLVEAGACIVGGCCGTSPAHITAIARAVAGMKPVVRSQTTPVTVREPAGARTIPRPPAEGARLARVLGKKYIVTVELDLPRGVEVEGILEGARSLKEHGCDLIDISDGARARLRMNPMAVAHLIQEQVGIEVMMHFSCRDRNLLAVQADLLGAHVLGLRNILAITGDPAQIGDYPLATSVYDVDSVGLIRILRHFNEGLDLAGNSIAHPTAFTIAAAFDPLAVDMVRQSDRLKRKIDEGAQIIYTQPIFEWAVLEDAVSAVSRHNVPLFFGLLPLRSSRHAEFIHNEVPGMCIPEIHRRRLAELEEKEARKYGIEVAREFLARAHHCTQGVYLMPPFGNHRVAEAVLKALA